MKKHKSIKGFLILVTVLFVGVYYSEPLLASIIRPLISQDSLGKAEAIVVLAGSNTGNRMRAAARIYHEGFGKKVVFSGFEIYPGTYTNSLMRDYAKKLGIPEKDIITSIPNVEASTRGESVANLELLRKNNIHKFILVTSAYHTARAKSSYEKTISSSGYEAEFIVHAAKDPIMPVKGWWKLRTGQKGVFYEYIKSIAYYFNL